MDSSQMNGKKRMVPERGRALCAYTQKRGTGMKPTPPMKQAANATNNPPGCTIKQLGPIVQEDSMNHPTKNHPTTFSMAFDAWQMVSQAQDRGQLAIAAMFTSIAEKMMAKMEPAQNRKATC
jgi:hypothetical protein